MRAVVLRLLARTGGSLVEKDVREDPELEKRYLFEIPVLLRGAVELARHRVTEEQLKELIARTVARERAEAGSRPE